MKSKDFTRKLLSDLKSTSTIALVILALTQVPVALKTIAELACIGEVSNKRWREDNSHSGVNVYAVSKCNGN